MSGQGAHPGPPRPPTAKRLEQGQGSSSVGHGLDKRPRGPVTRSLGGGEGCSAAESLEAGPGHRGEGCRGGSLDLGLGPLSSEPGPRPGP